MNYISSLSKEKKIAICKIITGNKFKKIFTKNGKVFSKIKPGFRVKSLTDSDILDVVIKNIDDPSISSCVNDIIKTWITEINVEIAKLQNEDVPYNEALASILIDSFFSNDINIYFAIIGKQPDCGFCKDIKDKIKNIKLERIKKLEIDPQIQLLEEENNKLRLQIVKLQKDFDFDKANYTKLIDDKEKDTVCLKGKLKDAQEEILKFHSVSASSLIQSNDYDWRVMFEDTDTSVLPIGENENFISLCEVINNNNQKFLIRHADLNCFGSYDIFHKIEDILPSFTNRKKIFYDGNPDEDGFFGVWSWSVYPSEKDSSKDYVESKFNRDIQPIQVILIKDVSSLVGLAKFLKNGVECKLYSNRVMFTCYEQKGKYIGMLCRREDTVLIKGKVLLDDKFIIAPIYEFTEAKIMRLDNKPLFFRDAFAGVPDSIYYFKTPLEIVRDIVLSSSSWINNKSLGITRSEYKIFKEFLGTFPVNDIIKEISLVCRCSPAIAGKLFKEFVNVAYCYIDGNSLENEVIASVIKANNDLQTRTKELIYSDWARENEKILLEKRGEINGLEEQLCKITAILEEKKETYKQVKSEEQQIVRSIAEKKQLVNDVEVAIADRIQRARNNVADFITEMTFLGGMPAHTTVTAISTDDHLVDGSEQYKLIEENSGFEIYYQHNNWLDVLYAIEFELEEAGVAKKYIQGLSSFLCSAYIEKQPILLVGPNAIDIIKAFSFAVSGHQYGVLYCDGDYSNQIIDKIGTNGENIVVIINLFSSGWMNRLPEILSRKDIFFIVIHPYAEDIQVEPKGIYNFMLPLFTEFFVDKKPTGKYQAGQFADDFKAYEYENIVHNDVKLLTHFNMNVLIRNKINNLIAIMHDINSNITEDDDFLFAVLSFAYATMDGRDLKDVIFETQKGISISANLRRELQYILGEFK